LEDLQWPHGQKSITRHVASNGLISAVVESWYPASNDEYAVLLEDDISVSPYWYVYAKLLILQLRYSSSAISRRIAGLSLYTPRLMEIKHPRVRMRLDLSYPRNPLLLYQTPCSWGALYFPEPWRRFHRYMSTRMANQTSSFSFDLPGSLTNSWKESWKKFFFELMYARGEVLVYPNFSNQTSLATNHLEPGEHIGVESKSAYAHLPVDYTVPLMLNSQLAILLALNFTKALENPPLLNLFALPASEGQLDEAARQWCQDKPGVSICHS
jgi:hypothetical protein